MRPSDSRFAGDGEDARVVVAQPQSARQDIDVGVVELDAHGAARIAHRHGRVQAAVLDPKIVEQPQGLPSEVAQLGMAALGLQLGHHHDRDDDVVLVEPQQRARIGQQDGRVEDVGAAGVRVGGSYGHVGLLERATYPVTRCG